MKNFLMIFAALCFSFLACLANCAGGASGDDDVFGQGGDDDGSNSGNISGDFAAAFGPGQKAVETHKLGEECFEPGKSSCTHDRYATIECEEAYGGGYAWTLYKNCSDWGVCIVEMSSDDPDSDCVSLSDLCNGKGDTCEISNDTSFEGVSEDICNQYGGSPKQPEYINTCRRFKSGDDGGDDDDIGSCWLHDITYLTCRLDRAWDVWVWGGRVEEDYDYEGDYYDDDVYSDDDDYSDDNGYGVADDDAAADDDDVADDDATGDDDVADDDDAVGDDMVVDDDIIGDDSCCWEGDPCDYSNDGVCDCEGFSWDEEDCR